MTETRSQQERLDLARSDPNAFVEFCFSDEAGGGLKQADHHREWQAIFTDQTHVALLGAAELGKTQQVAFRVVWELGHNANLRCFVVSASQEAAVKIVGVIKRAIEENPRVREVFPDLLPGSVWNSSTLLVRRKGGGSVKDYSVQAYGYGSRFLGIRADLMIVDDINDDENSLTPESRERIISWFDQRVQTRITQFGRVWVIGNAWHPDDLIHTLARRGGFYFKRFAVLVEQPANDNAKRGKIVPLWPAQFPLSRIAAIRSRMPPLAFARAYMCLPISDETQRFDEEWFDRAKERGAAWQHAPSGKVLANLEDKGWQLFCGVDLSTGKKGRDTSVLFVLGYHPRSRDLLVLDVRQGRWKAPELLEQMRAIHTHYRAPLFMVESNGFQQYLVDSEELAQMRVVGVNTGVEKWDPTVGIEGLAFAFNGGRWIIPSTLTDKGERRADALVERCLADLLAFTPGEHTSDLVMAMWISVKGARMCSRDYAAHLPRILVRRA